jgi:hypothetical protein
VVRIDLPLYVIENTVEFRLRRCEAGGIAALKSVRLGRPKVLVRLAGRM